MTEKEKIKTIHTGRRKSATARVKLIEGTGKITINNLALEKYFTILRHQIRVKEPLTITNNLNNFDVIANVRGGGISGQADAVRLGIARALLNSNENIKPALKKAKLLTRDPREKERKKYGRKRARRRFQYSKR